MESNRFRAAIWDPPRLVATCLSSHLKTICIRRFWARKVQMEVVKYLLENGHLLDKMIIMYADPLYLARSSAAPTSPPTSASLGLEIDGFPFLFHFPLARPGSEINGFISEVFLGACCRFRLVAEKTTKENLELNTQEFESELIFSA
ncbi:unnamed protein product [Prunus armeniaca]